MDCKSSRLTGSPASTRLSRTLLSRLIPRFLKFEKLRHHITVNSRTNGITNINDGNCVGLVPIKMPNNIRPAMLEMIMERFIISIVLESL